MRKVAVVIGHSLEDGGAYNENFAINEFRYNEPIASMIASELYKLGVCPVIIYRSTYDQMITDVNRTEADLAIELHCNGVLDKSVKGSETLYYYSSKSGLELAKEIQKSVVGVMGQRDRGPKPIKENSKDSRGWKFLKNTKMTAVILEPFFLSNDDSLQSGIDKADKLALAIASAIKKYLS